ncbi:MAG: hypothetical protein AB7I79_00045 [Rhizobiaceae bacterium]
MLAPRLLVALAAAFIVTSAPAREQSDAPFAEVVGFSADGRYFAWEEYAYDIVSDALVAAIHVIDRESNLPAPGFPFGVVPEEADGSFPVLVGGFAPDPALLDTNDFDPDLDALRTALREAASPKLGALGIGRQGRRVAGVPMTQRSPAESRAAPLSFVIWPTIPGPIPDQQLSYTIDARRDPEDPGCANANPPQRMKPVTFDVIATSTWPEIKDVSRKQTMHSYRLAAGECDAGLWLSEIFVPPGKDHTHVAVLYLTSHWGSFTESARWRGAFVALPDDPR